MIGQSRGDQRGEMAHRPVMRTTRRRTIPHKNAALVRWLRKLGDQPDDRGEQWWDDFEAQLRQTLTRFRPVGA